MDDVRIKIGDKEIEVKKGTTLLELSKRYASSFKFSILGAYVDNVIKELSYQLNKDAIVEFFDLSTSYGNMMYVNTLVFACNVAIKELYGSDKEIIVEHSIDKSMYISTNFNVNEDITDEIETKIRELAKEKLEIKKVNTLRKDAIKYFESINDLPKAGMLNYNTNTYITLYRLNNIYDYFFCIMPMDTGVLTDFEISCVNNKGFVLRYPTVYCDTIKDYRHRSSIYDMYEDYRLWQKTIGINGVADLNDVVTRAEIDDLIRVNEVVHNTKLIHLAKDISQNRKNIRVILLAGPSSSGKTTTTRKLCVLLKNYGVRPKMLSLDDYFKERKDTPKDKEGNYDFESLGAVDIDLFNEQISALLKGETIKAPVFNFKQAKKEFIKDMSLEEDDVLVIEGIHCLNPVLLKDIPDEKKFKIYLAPFTKTNLDSHNRFSSSDTRLLRRIVRDTYTRGINVEESLKQWKKVRIGEEENIYPYQDNANFVFNTYSIYEIGVLRTYVEPLLYSVSEDSPYYEEARRLLNLIKIFLPISSEAIPADSILREFIGGSCYKE